MKAPSGDRSCRLHWTQNDASPALLLARSEPLRSTVCGSRSRKPGRGPGDDRRLDARELECLSAPRDGGSAAGLGSSRFQRSKAADATQRWPRREDRRAAVGEPAALATRCRAGCANPSGCPSRCSPRRRRLRSATTTRTSTSRAPVDARRAAWPLRHGDDRTAAVGAAAGYSGAPPRGSAGCCARDRARPQRPRVRADRRPARA